MMKEKREDTNRTATSQFTESQNGFCWEGT